MDIYNVSAIFEFISGESVNKGWTPVVELAVGEVTKMLLPDADPNDERLEYFAASIANLRAQQILAASAKSENTFIGKMKSERETPSVKYARSLMRDYCQMCSDLIKPQTFVFAAFS